MDKRIKVRTEHISRDRRIELTNYFLDKPMEGVLIKSKNDKYVIRHIKLSGAVKYYGVASAVTNDMVDKEVLFTLEGDFDNLVAINVKLKG